MFGVTGDLARKKLLPAIYDLANRGLLPPSFGLVGYGRRDWDDEQFADYVLESVKRQRARTPFRAEVWRQLAEGIRFVSGAFNDDEGFENLKRTIAELDETQGTEGNHAFYLSIPPDGFDQVIEQLRRHGLVDKSAQRPTWNRVVIEKPFGHDLASARSSSARSPASSTPTRCSASTTTWARRPSRTCWRCGSPTSCSSRCGTATTSATSRSPWPRTSASAAAPATTTASAPPATSSRTTCCSCWRSSPWRSPPRSRPGNLRAEKEKVLAAARAPRNLKSHTARGQYTGGWAGGQKVLGYLEEDGIAPDSQTETYAAFRVDIDNRRWAGVPFYLRAAKRMPRRVTEIALMMRPAPHLPFQMSDTEQLGANALVLRIQPDEGITLRFGAKVPATQMEIRDVTMDFDYGTSFAESSPEAYERLILDVLLGDPPLFPQHT